MAIPRGLGFITVPSPGTPVVFSPSPLLASRARIRARSASATPNVGNIYIGQQAMNKSTGAGVYRVLGPEESEPLDYGAGYIDLGQWYVDADNASDGVQVGYTP